MQRTSQPALGLATMRRDGFVSMEAGDREEVLLTKPLTVTGTALHLNLSAPAGHVVAELTDDRGGALAGYTSHPTTGDAVDIAAPFERPVEALAGQTVRLRLRLRNASLLSYWFD